MERLNFPQGSAEQAVSIIKRHVNPCTVYVFGYRNDEGKPYFYLLVFAGQDKYKGIDIANFIAMESGNRIKATVLLHKPTDLATLQPHQQRFFDSVLRHGQRLCIDKAAPPYLQADVVQAADKEADEAFWLKCVAVAQFNINAAKDSEHLEVELCKIALLHTACVQIALGLIRVCLGYVPNEHGLNYLFNLCGHFTDIPIQIFHNHGDDARRYKMLCAPPSMLNHWLKLDAKEADFLWLLDACEQFLELSSALATKQFETITN